MENLLKKYLKGDATLWIVFIGLCILSTIEMYSASSTLAYKASNHAAPMLKHVTFLSLGALLAFFVHLVPYKYIRISSYLGLFLSFLLLIYVLFKGQSANDAARFDFKNQRPKSGKKIFLDQYRHSGSNLSVDFA